jgi:anti-sigma regulatory factor (Ser/Thr protein kinase)
MNNVLLPIRCRLDALQDGTLPDSHREHFESVRRSVEYLQQLTDGLHLLSLDPNEPQPVGESVDVANWWEQVGQLLTTAVPRHATLACELPDDLPPIAMPPHGLTQAILNLIVNAGEAMTEPGTIRIWAEADESRGVVRLRVADDGPGMPPEVRRRALDPFFTTKKRGLGTGLGLSLVHSVAQTAGGSVQIESEPGRGTTVTMIFPIASGDDGRPAVDLEAAISLEDRRLATLLSALLQTAGLATQHVEGRTPPETDLWVTSPTATPVDAAREFMQTSRRQIVLVGEADDAWRELTVITIDPTADFGVIRERVGETVAALTRATRT